MNSPVTTRPVAATSPGLALLPIMAVVFAAYRLIGLAIGAYTAFLDLSLGVASPALGLVASDWGLSVVFLISARVLLSTAGVVLQLLRDPAPAVG